MRKSWIDRANEYLNQSLTPLPQELNEIDWKEDLSPNTDKLLKHLSAFANHPGGGFIVLGISNKPFGITGIDEKKANAIVEKLSQLGRDALDPMVVIDHAIETYQGVSLLFVFIKESAIKPVHIKNKTIEECFIRTGGCTQKASRHEVGSLMLNSKTPNFEELHASKLKSPEEVLELLDYKKVYELLGKPLPQDKGRILHFLTEERLVANVDGAGFYITNFGAVAAAHSLKEFDSVSRKAIRLIEYKGRSKVETVDSREYPGTKGYAVGFEGLIEFVKRLLPASEVLRILRSEQAVYPEIALREIIANALIHQDFTIRGSGPMIEIFEDRIEVTNPGKLLPKEVQALKKR